jgi:hypothetical protein
LLNPTIVEVISSSRMEACNAAVARFVQRFTAEESSARRDPQPPSELLVDA